MLDSDGNFKMDIEFDRSEYKRKYWTHFDSLSRLETEAACWHDALRVSNSHFRLSSKHEHFIHKIYKLRDGIQTLVALRAGRTKVRKASDLTQIRISAALALTEVCIDLIHAEVDKAIGIKPEGSVVAAPHPPSCDGKCAVPAAPLLGWRYCCSTCDKTYCVACFNQHSTKHVFTLHHPDAVEDQPLYALDGVIDHTDSRDGRLYLISWVGDEYDDSLHMKEELNNDYLIEEYTHTHVLHSSHHLSQPHVNSRFHIIYIGNLI